MMLRLLIYFCVATVLLSCSPKTSTVSSTTSETATTPTVEEKTIDYEKKNYQKASILDMSALDACGFMLKLEGSGKRLNPDKMGKAFHVDGMQVWIKYSLVKGGMSTCMSGTMITLLDIQQR